MTAAMVVFAFAAGIVVGVWVTWDLLRHRTAEAVDAAWLDGYEHGCSVLDLAVGKGDR